MKNANLLKSIYTDNISIMFWFYKVLMILLIYKFNPTTNNYLTHLFYLFYHLTR